MTQFLMISMSSNMLIFFIILWIWRKHRKLQKIHEVIPIKSKKIINWTKVFLIILVTNFISYLIIFIAFYMQKGG